MNTKDIFTALNYPDGVRKIGDGVDQNEVLKFIAGKYPPETKIAVYEDIVHVIDRQTFKALKNDQNRACALVDTQDGTWNDIFFLPKSK